jgi:hypothetical protein
MLPGGTRRERSFCPRGPGRSLRPVDSTQGIPRCRLEIIDYNGEGRWSRAEILGRYTRYVAEIGIVPRDLSPMEHAERGRRWVYPVMMKVIDGIEAGDLACVQLGIEFIEDDAKFPFGKALKSNTARALRRARLSNEQKQRIRRRVFGLLRPHSSRVPRVCEARAKDRF